MWKKYNSRLSLAMVANHLLCAGPAYQWLHHPALKGGGESGGRHEENPFCILTEVHNPTMLKQNRWMYTVKAVVIRQDADMYVLMDHY